jgi:hypothetical protein
MTQGIFTMAQQLQGQIRKVWSSGNSTSYVEYLVVAGGGGGGGTASGAGAAGGGGAGGLLQGIYPITAGSPITVTVGSGGAGGATSSTGSNGQNSVFGNITAIGGGGGASQGSSTLPTSGGSGGGAALNYAGNLTVAGGFGVFGQGNQGGGGQIVALANSGGGGGAGTAGNASTTNYGLGGGAGIASSISGTLTAYAGGGAGGQSTSLGGVGGGGASTNPATAGTTNTGGGGGANYYNGSTFPGGAGGSGIVILSYPDTYNAPSALTGTYTASTSGSGSVLFNGSSGYLTYPLTFSYAGDFCIECWFNTTTTTNYACLYSDENGSIGATILLNNNSNNGQITVYIGSTVSNFASTVTGLNNGAWHQVALTRSGSTLRLFVDGVLQNTGTYSGTLTTSSGTTRVGNSYYSSRFFGGYISNFRMVSGNAVYTSAFTPPTAPLNPISGTQILLNTVSGSPFTDSSTNALTPTGYGTPTWNQLSPFATGLGYKNRVYTWTGSGTVTF